MADHHHHQPMVAAAAAAAYPRKQINDSMAFLDEILAELDAAPDVRYEFFRLLSGFGKHGGDADAVGSRAVELLRGHPNVLRRFISYVHMDVPAEQGLALTRPRCRRRRSERRDTQQQIPAAATATEAPPYVAAAARNRHGDNRGLRLADADAAQALTFVKRVHETAGPVVHARFLAVLSEAKRSEDMSGDEIYDRAKQAFGPAHVGLLHAFATAWLPGEQEWKLQQLQLQARGPAARQRSRAAAAADPSHAAAGIPGAKNKKSRADDDGNARRYDPAVAPRRQRNSAAAASMPDAKNKKPRADDGNNGRPHDHVIAVMEVRNVKKRRGDDDGTGRGHDALRISQSSGGGAAPPQGRDYDYDYAPRSRAKKHHSGNGDFSGSTAAARVLSADAITGVHHAHSADNDKKPPRRRAASGGLSSAGPKQQPKRDDEVRRFRREWEFQTYYSKLVATSDRVKELLRATRTRTTPHGDGGGGGGGNGNRSLEAVFPLPECREFLHRYYGDRWGEMRAVLERGESRVPALEAIESRLMTKEEEAVVEESRKRCQHDPVRVAQRLHGLAMDYALDEECRRHHADAVHERPARACSGWPMAMTPTT